MDPSLKLPPVHALFLPFASDRVGLLASIGRVGDLSFSRMSWHSTLWRNSGIPASPTFGLVISVVLASGTPASQTSGLVEFRSASGAASFCTLPSNARRSGVAA